MERIRVHNLRCLADTGPIEIKPITILVGANSSGKSSFLRVFPLLKQSAETRTLSGILLNEGDVNFGFFPEAVHREADPSELRLGFGLTLKQGIYRGAYVNRFLIAPIPVLCDVRYTRRAKDSRYPYISSVELTIENTGQSDTVEIVADEDGKLTTFRVNALQANGEIPHMRLRVGRGIVPTLGSSLGDKTAGVAELDDDESLDEGLFEKRLLSETSGLFHGRTTRTTRLGTLRSIGVGSPEQMLKRARAIGSVNTWSQNVARWTVDSARFRKMRDLLLAKYTGEILTGINNYVSQLARSVHYFQPVRAGVQRDYLSRDVQVSSVDPSGSNVAMVLASLSPSMLRKFRDWLLTHFRFEVYPQSVGDGARIALRMREAGSNTEFNLADMGFGFSQMLPFIVQIWYVIEYESTRPRSRGLFPPSSTAAIPRGNIVAIEQPELHLHPALQSSLADLFVAMSKLSRERDLPIRFVLETHSPTIIERVGAHVEAGSLLPQDVQVILFDRGENESRANTATVTSTEFDGHGVLKHWPFGFLAPPPTPVGQAWAQPVAQ
jgi:hypothetical protein